MVEGSRQQVAEQAGVGEVAGKEQHPFGFDRWQGGGECGSRPAEVGILAQGFSPVCGEIADDQSLLTADSKGGSDHDVDQTAATDFDLAFLAPAKP